MTPVGEYSRRRSSGRGQINSETLFNFQSQGSRYKTIILGTQSDSEILFRINQLQKLFEGTDRVIESKQNRDKLSRFAEDSYNWEAILQFVFHYLETKQNNATKEQILKEMVEYVFQAQRGEVIDEIAAGLDFEIYEFILVMESRDMSSLPGLKRFTETKSLAVQKVEAFYQDSVEPDLCLFLNQVIEAFNNAVEELNLTKPLLDNTTTRRIARKSMWGSQRRLLKFFSLCERELHTTNMDVVSMICGIASQIREGLSVDQLENSTYCICDHVTHDCAELILVSRSKFVHAIRRIFKAADQR